MVGVVGAARVPGIRNMWPQADSPELVREVQEYLTVPYTARSSAAVLVPVVTTGDTLASGMIKSSEHQSGARSEV